MNHKIDDIALHGALSANVVGFCRLLRTQAFWPGLGRGARRAPRSSRPLTCQTRRTFG